MEEENKEKNIFKKNFFEKVKMSIANVEKYPELAVEGVPRAITYLLILISIMVFAICISLMIKVNTNIKNGLEYIENDFPNFSYSEGILNVESDKEIKIENEENFGKMIIDTKNDDNSIINQYINEINDYGTGILILKDKVILKNNFALGSITFNLKELSDQIGITKFQKQDLIDYFNSFKMVGMYFSLFIMLFIYGLITYFLMTIMNVLLISLFGNIASLISRVKLRYAAIFNMTIYSITLPTILYILYILVNIFVDFNIQYFDVMYISISAIYIFAAIFILKDDLIKKQLQLMKITKAQQQVKNELKEKQQEKNEDKDNNKENDKKENQDEEEPKEQSQEPDGENA